MEREDLFDADVEPVICEYVNADEVLPFTEYVEIGTFNALLRNYHKVKKAYIKVKQSIEENKIGEYPKHEYCKCVSKPIDKLHKFAEKPPLGVKPCFIQAEERIKDLADAISRYANRGDYEIIKRWANEILMQCDNAEMEKDD